nr:ubiquitin-specific protease 13 [Tanacetum cinerariifolium]
MDIRDQTAVSKRKLKIVPLSIQANDVDHGPRTWGITMLRKVMGLKKVTRIMKLIKVKRKVTMTKRVTRMKKVMRLRKVNHQLVNNLITTTVKGKTTKGKKKDVACDSESKDETVKKRGKKTKVIIMSKKREHVKEEKPIIKKKQLDAKKKKKKPMTLAQIKKEKYLSGFPPLRFRTVPCSLFAAIRDSQVDMKSFLSDIRFSSLQIVFIDTLPSRFSRFVVTTFTASNNEFKLEKGVIRVTPKKVHEILGVPLGGTSIYDFPERPLDDDFVKMWFNQFNPNLLKDIRATDISVKLVTSIYDFPERPLDDDFVKMWFNQFNPNLLKDIRATDISIQTSLKLIDVVSFIVVLNKALS